MNAYHCLDNQRKNVQRQIDNLHALPYAVRSDYWYSEIESRLQQSLWAIGQAIRALSHRKSS